MTAFWTEAASIAGAILLLTGFKIRSDYRFKRLLWPRRLGYFGFKRRVVRYLRRTGWTVDTKPWVPVDFLAGKSKQQQIVVVLLPSDTQMTSSRITDIAGISFPFTKSRQLVCITLDEVDAYFVKDGASKSVKIVYYKDLDSL